MQLTCAVCHARFSFDVDQGKEPTRVFCPLCGRWLKVNRLGGEKESELYP